MHDGSLSSSSRCSLGAHNVISYINVDLEQGSRDERQGGKEHPHSHFPQRAAGRHTHTQTPVNDVELTSASLKARETHPGLSTNTGQ